MMLDIRFIFIVGLFWTERVCFTCFQVLEADSFRLHCFQTLTGVKFIAVVDNTQTGVDALLRRIYELYADYALKNPFYSLEMPIRCELFESNLRALLDNIEKVNSIWIKWNQSLFILCNESKKHPNVPST